MASIYYMYVLVKVDDDVTGNSANLSSSSSMSVDRVNGSPKSETANKVKSRLEGRT